MYAECYTGSIQEYLRTLPSPKHTLLRASGLETPYLYQQGVMFKLMRARSRVACKQRNDRDDRSAMPSGAHTEHYLDGFARLCVILVSAMPSLIG